MSNLHKEPPIRVCFIAPKAYPLFNPDVKEVFGGAEVDLYFLATELAKDKNFAVSFITADYGQEKIEIVEGVKLIKSLNFKKNPLNGTIKVWRAMHTADAQIYFQKTVSLGTFLVAFFCKRNKRIFAYRTAWKRECDGTYIRQHPILGRSFTWALRKAGYIFTQNKTDRENLHRTIGASAIVIPNGHRMTELCESRRDIILWVGRSAAIKNPKLFIDLAEQIPNENFTLVCQHATDDKNYDKLAARAKQVKNLEFIERVPFGEIDSYFRRAKVFVNTSEVEGFPNTFIQACMCATPILSLNVNPDGFLDEYGCGICCNNDTERLTDSLRFMLAEKRFLQMGKKARVYVEQNHDVKKIVEEYKRLFYKLC